MKHAARRLSWLLLLFFCASGTAAEFGSLLDDQAPMEDLALPGEERLTEAQVREKIAEALRASKPAEKRKLLAGVLKIVARRSDIVFQPREWAQLTNEIVDFLPRKELRPFVGRFLKAKENMTFDPNAKRRFNFGLQLAMVAGGASFAELREIHQRHRTQADMNWLLPALGRIGGREALPILRQHGKPTDSDKEQGGTHAVVLGFAYAGDEDAFRQVLTWYDSDFIARPRHAFNVAWTIRQKQKPSYAELDACQHRIRQAERLLNAQGPERLKTLLRHANEHLLVALPDYLLRRLAAASADELPIYLDMLDHPSIAVKQQVLAILVARGNEALRKAAMEKVRGMVDSERATDRFFALETLMIYEPNGSRELVKAAIEKEPSRSVRRRIERFVFGNGQ